MTSINFRFKLFEIINMQEILKEMETERMLDTLSTTTLTLSLPPSLASE